MNKLMQNQVKLFTSKKPIIIPNFIDEDELFFIHKMVKGEKDFYVFVTEYWYGDIELDHEHEEFEWVPIKELPDKLQIPTDGIIFYMLNSLYNIV